MYFVSVLEGETLSKVCSYTGADNPDYIKFGRFGSKLAVN